jgi:hypothetical protein
MEWHRANSETKPNRFKQSFSTGKLMATVSWDKKGILLVDFMIPGDTINAHRYCETLRKLRRAIQNKRRGFLLLHDNGRPHVAGKTRELLERFK